MGEYSALEGGPPCFGPDFTCPALLGTRLARRSGLSRTGPLPCSARLSRRLPLARRFATGPGAWAPPGYGGPTTPRAATPPGFTACTGLGSSPLSLAATRGISFDFSSSGYLDVSVPPVVPARPMSSGGRARALPRAGFPIRRPAGRRPFAPLRRLSQLVASFVGFPCQGIRRVPLVSSRTFSLLRSLKIRFLL